MYAVQKIFDFARETPDDWALVYDLEPITYRAWHRMVTAMRHRLAGHDLRPGGVAVVWMHSILASWVVDLALRSLGLITVAIYTASELDALGDLDIVAVLTLANEPGHEVPAAFAPAAPRITVEPADWTPSDDGGALEPPPPAAPSGHILLTSGTTGQPKKILVDAEQEVASNAATLERYQSIDGLLQVEDRRITINLLNFGLWTAGGYIAPSICWSIGATAIIHQGAQAERSLTIRDITHVLVTPFQLVQILEAPASLLPRNDDLQVLVAGGALSLPLANRTKARLTRRIATTFGSTESGGWAMTPVETDEDLRWHRLNPARVVQVVDEDDQPVPHGQLGQVRVLQNNGVSGYLNDPAASAAFFRDGYFYPGDLGVLDGKGRLTISGRATDILNLLGHKIPTAPFEQALQTAFNLDGVCLLSEPGPDRSDELHVVLETPAPIDPAMLRETAWPHLRELPDVRVHFHFLDALPRNHMGKIERLKLRRLLFERQRARASQ